MPEIDESARQLHLRLVYFGPPRSGKSTNLQRLHDLLAADSRGRLKAFDSAGDRTVSFDVSLPVAKSEWTVQVNVCGFSSPLLRSAKASLLEGADAVALVTDSMAGRAEENQEAIREADALLRSARVAPRPPPPIVLQLNKRDLADRPAEEDLERSFADRGWPIFTAAAKHGDGVRETFTFLLRLAFEAADQRMGLSERTGLTLAGVTASALKALRRGHPA